MIVKKAAALALIGAVSALLLGVVNSFTEPVITERRAKALQRTLGELTDGLPFGAAEEFQDGTLRKRWPILGASGGWVLELEAKGYGGPMTLVASFDDDGGVLAARLMENDETVGIGKKAEDPRYMDLFVGRGSDLPLRKSDLGEDLDMVSGATVTFRGIARALKTGSELVKQWEK